MGSQGKKFLHLPTLPQRRNTKSFIALQRNRRAMTCATIVNSHPRASFIPSNLTHSAIYLPSPETNNPPETSDAYSRVFNSNTKWRGSMAERDPALFERLSKGQSPQILWIGCADSRCPETTILGLNPGDVFVHRNIANILIPTDLNSLSVIQYAVQYLEVKHIVVCGHTSCGGIAAALDNKKLGLIDMWLMPLRQLRRENLKLLESMDEKAKGLKLVELNVRSGIDTLMDNPVVLDAVTERGLKVHGLIYDVGTGELNELDINETEEKINSRTTAFKTA
jgi:carbonic anhydrase